MLSAKHAVTTTKSRIFRSIVRPAAKLRFALVAALAAVLSATPSFAENFAFVSANGGGTACTAAAPCKSIGDAFGNIAAPIRIICLSGSQPTTSGIGFAGSVSVDIDCPLGFGGEIVVGATASNLTMRLRHLEFRNIGFSSQIVFQGGGTLILEDCVFTDAPGVALDIEPNGPLNLIIKNTRISNGAAAGVLIKPAAGGSVTATFDGVTITKNAGGLKTDTTNGPVTVDISNSNISNNANNGLIAIGGAGGQNIMNLSRDVIASNGQAGIEVSGTTAGAIVDTTLLDSNTLGALSAVSSGRILTYQNNRIVGSPGTGFTGTASPQ